MKLAIASLKKLKEQYANNQEFAARRMVEADAWRQQESEAWALCGEQIASINATLDMLEKSVEMIG